MSSLPTPEEPLTVIVAGGGPVGLTFSLNLAMIMGEHVKISIYEGRWFFDEQGLIKWQGTKQGKTRRDQVVTLQDHVIEQMPEYVQRGLFSRVNERVWPTSRNIPIREVEDRLFELIQPFVQAGQIQLIAENLNELSECLINGDFDVLVGTDGANSFVRRYCNIQMISEGSEYACGVAYDVPNTAPSNEQPLHQALNCILTVSQTRYLVNSSTSRRGYVNTRLIRSEYDELQRSLQTFVSRDEPIDLSDYDKCPGSPVWSIIRQGLEFFKIPSKYVHRVVPIEINVRHASIVVRELRFELKEKDSPARRSDHHIDKKYKTVLAFLAGDAAMNVHFWPGRGMNSGMKAAIALSRNIHRACTDNHAIHVRKPLRFLDFLDYEAFMARLRAREQQGRSLRVLVNPIDPYIAASYSYAHLPHCYARYMTKLVKKLQETRDRLVNHPEWPHQDRTITDDELKSASHRISHTAVAQLSLANPWPTREMSGVEILVEKMFPFHPKNYFPIPHLTIARTNCQRSTSQSVQNRFMIIWITGEYKSHRMERMLKEILNYPEFNQSSPSREIKNHLKVFSTIDQVEEWLKANKSTILRSNLIMKVVTIWKINATQTAVDVICAVRSECPRAPFLIFTNHFGDARPALEFPYVMATDTDFEVKEFVGIHRETQWDAGCKVSHTQEEPKLIAKQIDTSPSLTTAYTRISPRSSLVPAVKLPPLVIWINAEGSDEKTCRILRENHPSLEIKYIPTCEELENYFRQDAKRMVQTFNVILVSRGIYRSERKTFLDLIQLLKKFELSDRPFTVYTRNRKGLIESVKNIPSDVSIIDGSNALIDFIEKHLESY